MRNRFNLNEEDKKHIRGLHGIQQPINEQEVLKKIAEEDYAIAKKEAQRFIDGKFKNKTVNLYTADDDTDEERSAMGPWKISQVELIGDLYDFHVDRYDDQSEEDDRDGAELEVLIYFDVIPESKEKEDEYHWPILRERRAKVMKAYWDCSTGQYKGYSDDLLWNDYNEDFAFTNSGLIKDLKSLCNGTNAFTEFNDLFDGSWKLIKGGMDYGMGDNKVSKA
tara:strand:+ start:113 stop:778 length:666 start_codon:yes stop_codon:yes gene_type:complete